MLNKQEIESKKKLLLDKFGVDFNDEEIKDLSRRLSRLVLLIERCQKKELQPLIKNLDLSN